jgi:uncharacterized protein YkwD
MGKGLFWAFLLFVCATTTFADKPGLVRPIQDEEKQIGLMLDSTNYVRNQRRIAAVSLDPRLCRAAAQHAEEMARYNYVSDHGRGIFLTRSNPGMRAWANGYAWASIAETVCAGSPNVASVLNSWLRSAAHARILTDVQYQDAGIGIARSSTRTYWVLMLARKSTAGSPKKNWEFRIIL